MELLTFCYQQDDDRAHQLLTYELRNWSKQTCLSLAVAVNHRSFIAQPCCQILLADLWLGGLRTRKNTNIKVKFLSELWQGLIVALTEWIACPTAVPVSVTACWVFKQCKRTAAI